MTCRSGKARGRLQCIGLVLLLLPLAGQGQALADSAFCGSDELREKSEAGSTRAGVIQHSSERLDRIANIPSDPKRPKPRFDEDPWNDHVVTCEEMQKHSTEVFSKQEVDLGSGLGSPNEVDYSCQGGLASLKYLKGLYDLTELIRSEGPQFTCSGSIVHAHWRFYHYDLLKAGFAPDISARDNQEPKDIEAYRKYQNKLSYFKLWAHQSLRNFELYRAFWKEYNKARPLLITHYKKKFDVSSRTAALYADNALSIFVRQAAGDYPYNLQEGRPSITPLQRTITKPNVAVKELKNLVKQNTSQDDLDWALKTALLYQRPYNVIELLLQRGARINSGDESALFFALRNRGHVTLLLERGAEVNYQNAFGKTVLFYAVGFNDIGLVQLLLRHKADVNQAYRDKATVEDIAWEDMPFYQSYCLLSHTKRTPLMHAAQHGGVKLIKLLLQHGAKLDSLDEKGYNAADYAREAKRPENVKYLEAIGLRENKPPYSRHN